MNIVAVILARAGSKGIPKKNLAMLGDRPLVAHMIGHALNAGVEMDVVLSTESEEIAAVGRKWGAQVPFMRPSHLAEDTVESLPVVQHAVNCMEQIHNKEYAIIVYLQPNAPLCRPQDIKDCVDTLQKQPDAESCVTITGVQTHPFKMKRLVDGRRVINYIDQGFEDMRPRQKLPPVYRRAGSVYASRRNVVMEKGTLVGDPCLGVEVPVETAIDIDLPMDLELARLLYCKRSEKGASE